MPQGVITIGLGEGWVTGVFHLSYLLILLAIALYGLHRYWLVVLYARHRKRAPQPAGRFDDLPAVTVQLPMYNEGEVAQRVIDAACAIDYPADRLQIQVVDDSTDESAQVARQRVAYWKQRGVDIIYCHRVDRAGYKAGALAEAMATATGRFIAVFDADFLPTSDFLRKTIDHFTDPRIGMVQARWGHLNRRSSLLTRVQAIFIDAHFAVEQAARNRSGRWFHFNGTAGIWRREAIESAGGWSADTLCEDLDLSIRSQLAGWKFVYLQDLVCPAELPPVVGAFKQQQHRWFKGTTQVMMRLLPRILASREVSLAVKTELLAQLLAPWMCVTLLLFSLLYYPALATALVKGYPVALVAVTLLTGLVAGAFFLCVGQYLTGRSSWYGLLMLPVMISAGIGLCVTNTRGLVEALVGHRSPFARTPKFNDTAETAGKRGGARSALGALALDVGAVPLTRYLWPVIEIAIGVYLVCCVFWAAGARQTLSAMPLLALFAMGYLWFGVASLGDAVRVSLRVASPPAPAPGAVAGP